MSEMPADRLPPENLTGPGRRVFDLASEEARALEHSYVGDAHLLLGLIREADSAAAKALVDEGVTLDAARAVVVEELGHGGEVWSQWLPTIRAKRVFELAARLADRGGPRLIGPEQILWSLVRYGEGYGALVLVWLGASLGSLHRQMAALSLPPPEEPDFVADVEAEGEWADLRRRLVEAGVPGGEWFGRAVTDPERHFDRPVDLDRGPRFDEKRAMPVLLEALPGLTDPKVVETVADYLARPWAKPGAFPALHQAFLRWAPEYPSNPEWCSAGWYLAQAIGHSATEAHLDELLSISSDRRLGRTRQNVVGRLGQFKNSPRVLATLLDLIEDHDVGLFAMNSLTAILSPAEALPHIERVERRHPDTLLGRQAAEQAWVLRRRLAQR